MCLRRREPTGEEPKKVDGESQRELAGGRADTRPDFRARVRRRDVLVGPIVTLGSPEVSELFALAGFDWLWLDLEHAPLSLEVVRQHLQAAGDRVGTVIRVPWNDEVHIKQALDLGCDGIIVPLV
jgi:2-keto-3-deoxy-L-rhamnonate aldolase RhmA